MSRLAGLLRLLVATVLLCNAVCTGICAALCNAHLCCRVEHGAMKAASSPGVGKVACCPHCLPALHPMGHSALGSQAPNCCDWIAKKADSPAAQPAHWALIAQPVGDLPAPVTIPARSEVRAACPATSEGDDRAPPDPSSESHSPRAPPVA